MFLMIKSAMTLYRLGETSGDLEPQMFAQQTCKTSDSKHVHTQESTKNAEWPQMQDPEGISNFAGSQ